MSRSRNNDEPKESVFVLTVPLAYDSWERAQLDCFFNAGLQIVHGLMTQKLKTLRNLERTKAWRANQKALRIEYSKPSAQRDEKLIKRLNAKRKAMLIDARLTSAAFETDVKKHRYHFNQINSQTAQKLAEQVWKSFETYLYGNGKQIHFMSWKNFTAMQGKSNTTGIRYSKGCLTAMTVETATVDLGNYARDGWDIPDDLTPELYAEIWNELLEEQFPA